MGKVSRKRKCGVGGKEKMQQGDGRRLAAYGRTLHQEDEERIKTGENAPAVAAAW
jgi:hypothetical protein